MSGLPPSVLQQEPTLGDLLDVKSFTEVCQSFAELYRVETLDTARR